MKNTNVQLNKKVLVAHPFKQHSFKTAVALKPKYLFKYVTTVYDKKGSLTRLTKAFFSEHNKQKAEGRKCLNLEDDETKQFCELKGLMALALLRLDKSRNIYNKFVNYFEDSFGKKVAKYAIINEVDAVIMYDLTASACFEYLKKKAPQIKRIMDVSAANLLYMKKVYENDMTISPLWSSKLYNERQYIWDEHYLKRVKNEIDETHYFLVPSQFVRKSLQDSGIKDEQMINCLYGVDNNSEVRLKKDMCDKSKLVNFVFVGGARQLKGISYLLDAFMNLPVGKATLSVIGECDLNEECLKPYIPYVRFTGRLLPQELKRLLYKMDVMVFPSIGEGFGICILEGLAAGLPVIGTENTGAKDCIIDEFNGFVVQPQSSFALEEKMNWFIDNKNEIYKMSLNAIDTAKEYSGENYNDCINKAIEKIFS